MSSSSCAPSTRRVRTSARCVLLACGVIALLGFQHARLTASDTWHSSRGEAAFARLCCPSMCSSSGCRLVARRGRLRGGPRHAEAPQGSSPHPDVPALGLPSLELLLIRSQANNADLMVEEARQHITILDQPYTGLLFIPEGTRVPLTLACRKRHLRVLFQGDNYDAVLRQLDMARTPLPAVRSVHYEQSQRRSELEHCPFEPGAEQACWFTQQIVRRCDTTSREGSSDDDGRQLVVVIVDFRGFVAVCEDLELSDLVHFGHGPRRLLSDQHEWLPSFWDVFCDKWCRSGKPFSFSAAMRPHEAVAALAILWGELRRQRQGLPSKDMDKPMHLVDGCCGSGTFVAVAAALESCFPSRGLKLQQITACDKFPEMLDRAEQNLEFMQAEFISQFASSRSESRVPVDFAVRDWTEGLQHEVATLNAGLAVDLGASVVVVANVPWGRRCGGEDDGNRVVAGLLLQFPDAEAFGLFVPPAAEAAVRRYLDVRVSLPLGKPAWFMVGFPKLSHDDLREAVLAELSTL
mmetsp:Transcript_13393/g.43364  ORF Transcript_13393/g.43364 Transcript_13393/m.43364 type:complete len:521 (-) Transcript_13393:58-1620(-)